jgi:uncharacterized membrane protein
MRGLGDWPHFLGFNSTVYRGEAGTQLLAAIGEHGDPFIAVREYGKGRTGIFASGAAPHWGPVEFLEWPGYRVFWTRFFNWLTRS